MGVGPLGLWEILIIVAVALIVFGPKKLPEVGRTVGKALSMFRKVSTDFQNTIRHEMQLEELSNMRMDKPPSEVVEAAKSGSSREIYPSEPETGEEGTKQDDRARPVKSRADNSGKQDNDEPYAG
ncbi:Sec-independent protein translocase protein TatB [Acidobacteriota bacterium]